MSKIEKQVQEILNKKKSGASLIEISMLVNQLGESISGTVNQTDVDPLLNSTFDKGYGKMTLTACLFHNAALEDKPCNKSVLMTALVVLLRLKGVDSLRDEIVNRKTTLSDIHTIYISVSWSHADSFFKYFDQFRALHNTFLSFDGCKRDGILTSLRQQKVYPYLSTLQKKKVAAYVSVKSVLANQSAARLVLFFAGMSSHSVKAKRLNSCDIRKHIASYLFAVGGVVRLCRLGLENGDFQLPVERKKRRRGLLNRR